MTKIRGKLTIKFNHSYYRDLLDPEAFNGKPILGRLFGIVIKKIPNCLATFKRKEINEKEAKCDRAFFFYLAIDFIPRIHM